VDGFTALGNCDTELDGIKIFLERIFTASLLDFYGCLPEPPEQYRLPEAFESFLGDQIANIISHEYIHKGLNNVNEEVASIAYDNLNYRLLESEQP
jgi:hypothetical protein